VTEEPETNWDSLDTYYDSVSNAVKQGMIDFYNTDISDYSTLDTVRVADTTDWIEYAFSESWCNSPQGYGSAGMSGSQCLPNQKRIFKDSTWQNECGLNCSKSYYACVAYRDSTIRACDTAWVYYDPPITAQVWLKFLAKNPHWKDYFPEDWIYDIICRDSVVVRRRR
jgi:hypothetical protein